MKRLLICWVILNFLGCKTIEITKIECRERAIMHGALLEHVTNYKAEIAIGTVWTGEKHAQACFLDKAGKRWYLNANDSFLSASEIPDAGFSPAIFLGEK